MKTFQLIRDRNYILDKYGYVYRVVGDFHAVDFITCYVRYYPSPNGNRVFKNKTYARNNFVYNSFKLVPEVTNNIRFSVRVGTVVTGVLSSDVKQILDTKTTLRSLYKNKSPKTEPEKALIKLIDLIIKNTSLELDELGITGSILARMHSNNSDIDLIVQGARQTKELKAFFDDSSFIEKYNVENADELYKRRSTHIKNTSISIILKQESRKIQGKFCGIHVNAQPIRDLKEVKCPFSAAELYYIGQIEVEAEIKTDNMGIYSPALYEISVDKVLSSENGFEETIKTEIKWLVSSVGIYSNCFLTGEAVFVRGKLCQVVYADTYFFAISIDPWSKDSNNVAKLLE